MFKSPLRSVVGPLLLFTLVALVTRWRVFGDPIITGVDEQFYVLVANRMLDGALPYVDIWDRKPIGLFLIYAAGALFGDVLLGSQIIALLAVVGTAFILYRLALRVASPFAAVMVGLIYIVFLTLAGGEGGQAPVYYNLLVVAAIATYLRARETTQGQGGNLRRGGARAMLLFGLALQVKYTVLFEGVFLGLVLLYTAWSRGRTPGALALDAAAWVGSALAPTILVGLFYLAKGHFGDWMFANFISIGLRTSEPMHLVLKRIVIILMLVAPLVIGMVLRLPIARRPADPARAADLRLLDGWAAAAALGVALFGTWFGHYALALFAPFALALAPLGQKLAGRIVLGLLFLYGLAAGQVLGVVHMEQRGDRRLLASATAAVAGQRNCLFVYDGPTSLYDASGSCLPSSRPFPENLRTLNESGGAVGIDELAEVRRIMAAKPDRVFLRDPAAPEDNPRVTAVMTEALRRDYVLTWRYPVQGRDYLIYSRRDGVAQAQAPASSGPLHVAKSCRAEQAPPWSDPVRRLVWHLAPIMGSCI
ncbi:hypothetical protein HNO88_000751 [Novosphingobium chloroacetimidivorans]|uniref:Glycosyltransferase RgtA/B/C/D-like domain-containing protein n=1 Tax=Novosphingobium chloroacetimidivorans TaxID=1428314 RepID=A0A7W7K723_9SPHN|nr:hypothetical protein [Novosphingobium chloroacetimidivorans]MBB4857444.1 hypothetical protein [Novosphingobium chloroacetimidivorans]